MAEVADGALVDGRYRIHRRIGSGGMADVYLAEDGHLGREVALKVLHRRFARDEQFVERFRREASAAAGLQHPNVVSVYDRGAHDGTFYIAMENLPGRTLRDLLRDEAPLQQERAIWFGTQILQAAGFAHRRGIVHRDFKPHNVIVAPDDTLKVTDFGIARAGASEMTETGSIMGTAQYLSPEQAQGHPVDARSDLYSIGVMLYEMLTGQVPFTGDSAVSIALRHVSDIPLPIRQLRPDVHPALEAAVMRALAKDPSHRYQSADEFIAALEEARAAIESGAEVGHTESWMPLAPLPPEEPRERRLWPWVTLILLLLLAGAAIAFFATRPDQVTVPSVVGQQAPAAATALVNSELKPQVVRVKSGRPVGIVVRQDPTGGARVEKASAVKLFVSSGPGLTTVPDVTGKSQAEAVKALKKSGLFATINSEQSTSVAKGKVIRTNPSALNQVQVGSRVDLFVSTGPPMVSVPGVVGKQKSDARAALEDAGLKVTVHEVDSEQPKDQVTAQDPAPGTQVAKGSRATISVSRGPQTVDVPNVVGQSKSDAESTLTSDGFTVRTIEQPVTDPTQDGNVVKQKPTGGKRKKGSTVTIYVGKLQQNGGGAGGNTSP